MTMGRPTKYSELLQAKADEYLANYEIEGEPVPTIAGLALATDVTRETVKEWAKRDDLPNFSCTVNRLKQIQEVKLLSGGLKNLLNAQIVKLGLHNHGYSDKSEVKDTTRDVDLMSEEELDAYIAERKSGSD